ncbi:MAG: TonB-dependent receptor [Polyangiaceae bacterium]
MARRVLCSAVFKVILAATPALAALVTAEPALAGQGQGVLVGSVVDGASKKPVADVIITITSPALQGAHTVVTDASGGYTAPGLPPGTYTVVADADGYKPYSYGGIQLSADSTIRLNVTMVPTALTADTVVVVDDAPTVDVGSSSASHHIDKDFTSHVPVIAPNSRGSQARSFESLAATTPGASTDTYGVSIGGTTSPENQFVIDGVGVNDPAYGILSTPLSIDFIEEVNIITDGYLPEFGRATGGVYDVITKSGSNEFHGSAFTYLTPGAFEAPRHLVRADGQTITLNTKLDSISDIGFDLGGPILKDKLWFYAAFDVAFTRFTVDRSLNRIHLEADGTQGVDEDGFGRVDPIAGTQTSRAATQRSFQYVAKLTYSPTEHHKFTIMDLGIPTQAGGDGAFGVDQQSGLPENQILDMFGDLAHIRHRYVAFSNDFALKYEGNFDDKKSLLDISFGWHHQEAGTLPADGSNPGDPTGDASLPRIIYRRSSDFDGNPNPHDIREFEGLPDPTVCNAPAGSTFTTLCPVYDYNAGGPDFIDSAFLNSFQLHAAATRRVKAAGTHAIKGGVDFDVTTYDHTKAYSGARRYVESTDGSYFYDSRQYGFLAGPDEEVFTNPQVASSLSFTAGAFVQDSWSIKDMLTINAGVRVDGQFLFGDDGKIGMALNNEWSPRIGAVFDPTRKGKSKIYANFAIYYESVPLDIVDRSMPGERQILSYHDAGGCDPRDPVQRSGSCLDDAYRYVVGTAADPNQYWLVTGGDRVPVDPDITPQSTSEFAVGGEYELFKKGIVGVQYTRRWMNTVIEDMSRDEGQTYFIGNPGSGIAEDFPDASRTYDAMNIYFEKKWDGSELVHWLTTASYTLSYVRGNWAGLFRPESTQLDPNGNSDFDLISLLPNREGPLPGDKTHQIKIYGAVEFTPKKFVGDVGVAFTTHSGEPTNYLGGHELYGDGEVYILPRGAGERLPWVHRFDLHLGAGAQFNKDSKLVFTIDIFNLFNFDAATAVDDNYTFSSVVPVKDGTPDDLDKVKKADGSPLDKADINPNFGNPSSYQAPRQFRLGLKGTF